MINEMLFSYLISRFFESRFRVLINTFLKGRRNARERT